MIIPMLKIYVIYSLKGQDSITASFRFKIVNIEYWSYMDANTFAL